MNDIFGNSFDMEFDGIFESDFSLDSFDDEMDIFSESFDLDDTLFESTFGQDFIMESGNFLQTIGKNISKFAVQTTYAFEDVMDVIGKKDTLFNRMKKIVIRTAKDAKSGDTVAILKVVGVTLLVVLTAALVIMKEEYITNKLKDAGLMIGKALKQAAEFLHIETGVKFVLKYLLTAIEFIWGGISSISEKIGGYIKTFIGWLKRGYEGVVGTPESPSLWEKMKSKVFGKGTTDQETTGDESLDSILGESYHDNYLTEGSNIKQMAANFLVVISAVAAAGIIAYLLKKGYDVIAPWVSENIIPKIREVYEKIRQYAGVGGDKQLAGDATAAFM